MVASPRAKFKTLIRTRMDATPLQNAVNYCRWIVDTVEASSRGHIGSFLVLAFGFRLQLPTRFPRLDAHEMDSGLNGTPMMSSNCWRAIEEAVLKRPRCRYLEWGSGNSTIAMLRLALKNASLHGAVLSSVEHDPEFASTLLSLLTQTFSDAATEVVISIGPIPKSKPCLVEALRTATLASLVTKTRFVQTLWDAYNHRFWITAAKPNAAHHQRLAMLHRRLIRLQGSAALRWERIRRALDSDARSVPFTILDTTHGRSLPREISPSLITFDSEQVRLEYLVTPQLRNRLSRRGNHS